MCAPLSCNDPCIKSVFFTVPVNIQPAQDVFRTGDTLWMEIIIDRYLMNQNNGDIVDIGYFDFNIATSALQYYDDYFIDITGQLEMFIYHGEYQIYGGIYKAAVLTFEIDRINEEQVFRLGIILDRLKGDFSVSFNSGQANLGGPKRFPQDKCTYSLKMSFLTNDGDTERIEKYMNKYPKMPDYLGVGYTVDKFRYHGYYFFTVE